MRSDQEPRTLLGLDIGTSSIKAALYDTRFRELADHSVKYEMVSREEGWAEIDRGVLWRAVLECIQKLNETVGLQTLAAIGIAAMCPGLVALDENFQPLIDPILYCDRRSKREAEEIISAVGEKRLFEITANKMMSGAISVTSMLWVKKNRPEVYRKTRWFGHINTMLAAMLTGVPAIDPSNASYTGLFETSGGHRWSEELCQTIGIPIHMLPPVLESQDVCGGVNNLQAIAAGIPAGTPLVIGGADTACTAAACGAIHAGDVFESVGTTDVLTVCIDEPLFCPEYINRYHVYPGKWMYQGAMSNSGFAIDWGMNELCRDFSYLPEKELDPENYRYKAYDREAAASQPGAWGVVFLPYLTGERCPIWDANAKGVFFGIRNTTRREDLVRAVAEGSCYAIRDLIGIYERRTGRILSQINMVGGGTRSAFQSQLKADITGKRVNVLKGNSASMGAAILASVGGGIYRSLDEAVDGCVKREVLHTYEPTGDPGVRSVYEQRFKTYLALYAAVKNLF